MDLLHSPVGASIDWTKIPAAYPPPGEIPNFIDPYSERAAIWVTSAFCSFIATVAVFARLYTKICIVKVIHIEDCESCQTPYDFLLMISVLLGASWIAFMVGVPPFILEGWQGAGSHQWNVTVAKTLHLLQLTNFCEAVYCLGVLFAKAAILLQMKRVLVGTTKGVVYWLIIALLWIIILFYSSAFFMVIFACTPREKIWQPWLEGHCGNEVLGDMIAGAFNLGTDLLMLLLPIYAIWKLKLALKQRLVVAAVFSTGLLACMFSTLRVYYGIRLLHSTDQTYHSIQASCVSMGEATTLTIIVCFPTIRLLFFHLRGKSPLSQDRFTRSGSTLPLRRITVTTAITRSDSGASGKTLIKPLNAHLGEKW